MATLSDRTWSSLRAEALNTRIGGEILRYITEQNLGLGDRLPAERDLAVLLDVSRPSVREAVRTLQAQGVLEVRHGAGVFIKARSPHLHARLGFSLPEDLTHLYDMRLVLEVPAARWAAERQRPELAAVADAYADLEAAIAADPGDYDQLQRLDVTFHARIVQACGNSLLLETQSIIFGLMLGGMRTTLSRPGRTEQSRLEHGLILKGLQSADPDLAEAAVRAHIAGARVAMREGSDELLRDGQRADRDG
jgi:GntR family transcriptional repressor for pyruvate dehydrogenase complex